MRINLAACSIDGLGNDYVLVAREAGADGPWWVTPFGACRHLPAGAPYFGGACPPYERPGDREAVEVAVRDALIDATSDTPSQGLRYALAMAFPSQRPVLGDWQTDDPVVVLYRGDGSGGDTSQASVVQQLVRHGRTRALGPIWDDAREAALLAWSSRAISARLALQSACDALVLGDGSVEAVRAARAERVAALAANLGEYADFKPRGGESEGLWLTDVLTGAEPVDDLRQVLLGHYGWRQETRITAFAAQHVGVM